jgi:hypothetical protein
VPRLRRIAEVAREHGVPLVSYEANHHLDDRGRELSPAQAAWMRAWLRSPEFGGTIRHMLQRFQEAGGHTAVLFADYGAPSEVHPWGLRSHPGQPLEAAPGWAAALGWAEEGR